MSDLPPLPPPPQTSTTAPETLAEIVELARRQNYSDIHLGVGEQPRFRERGEIISSDWPITEAVQFDRWLSEVLSSAERERFRSEHDFDGSFAFERVRVRINLMESLRGPAMVLRLIPQSILSLEELQLPEVLKTLANRPKGLVLVTGPTGSGKSTTLAAMVDWINRNKPPYPHDRGPNRICSHQSQSPCAPAGSWTPHAEIQVSAAGRSTGRPGRDPDR